VKKLIAIQFLISLFFIAGKAYSQTLNPPKFPGGEKAFSAYLSKNLKWPSKDSTSHGVVIISFFVENTGTLSNIAVKKGFAKQFDTEALRVITNSPKWTPTMPDNKPIKSKYSVPINFYFKG
jgi:TonB family protein